MSPVRLAALIGGAAAFAIMMFVVVHALAPGKPKAAPVTVVAAAPTLPTARVLVAARDLAVGDRLTAQDLTWQEWPLSGLNRAFIVAGRAAPAPSTNLGRLTKAADNLRAAVTGADQAIMAPFVGAVVREAMLKAEPLVPTKVVRATDGGLLAIALEPGMRAIAVPLTAESAAGGFILPGDHVDVVQSRQIDQPGAAGGKVFTSSTVLKNAKVLAIDQNTRSQKSANAVIGATATLEVSPSQSELIAMAKAQGTLTLVLRSYADVDGPAVAGIAKTEAVRTPVVRVFRNGASADVAVAR